ncbi:hypothetical protein BSIN_2089 [Burkholderia singularis]|uniref:Uncharacterized protein n=1 Tax=Burkholderia singularis TaxID=1503053 RepID=A0A238H0S1_9BURK|nr:hypothetical protein BSIN_2089 [Burkholderia singularis]
MPVCFELNHDERCIDTSVSHLDRGHPHCGPLRSLQVLSG